MQTNFAPEVLADPDMARSEAILRRCVHCGFCATTCPTYLINGDELDSPRGRIYLMKDMLERNRRADARTVRHIDRCLSCLACLTACPSGVNYMHLVDHARAHIEATYARPLPDRALRGFLALVLPRPNLFRLALRGARLASPLRPFLRGRLSNILDFAPRKLPPASNVDRPQVFPAHGKRVARAALLNGCAQTVLNPAINEATIGLLTRYGVEVVVVRRAGCCGALVHHLGKRAAARRAAAANVDAWTRERDLHGLDCIVANASGCGTMLKDYGHLLCEDRQRAAAAAGISHLARDVVEVAALLPLQPVSGLPRLRVAYHSACSLQNGQKITNLPLELLNRLGFEATLAPEAHVCCGSAGAYNLLQPEFATRLRARKIEALRSLDCDLAAAGNIGCITQIESGPGAPAVVHTVELLDWATGGRKPPRLAAGAGL